jgi:hypothetical protein
LHWLRRVAEMGAKSLPGESSATGNRYTLMSRKWLGPVLFGIAVSSKRAPGQTM